MLGLVFEHCIWRAILCALPYAGTVCQTNSSAIATFPIWGIHCMRTFLGQLKILIILCAAIFTVEHFAVRLMNCQKNLYRITQPFFAPENCWWRNILATCFVKISSSEIQPGDDVRYNRLNRIQNVTHQCLRWSMMLGTTAKLALCVINQQCRRACIGYEKKSKVKLFYSAPESWPENWHT